MKRKLVFGTIILTAFLLSGCTTSNAQEGGNGTGNNQTTGQAQGDSQAQGNTQAQGDSQAQGNTQAQGDSQAQENTQMQGNASLGETTQNNTSQGGESQGTMMSEEEVQNLALSFVEITIDDVTYIKCDLEDDDGRAYYDVEFYTLDKNDYDFEIDPYTGEIIEWDVEPIYDVNP